MADAADRSAPLSGPARLFAKLAAYSAKHALSVVAVALVLTVASGIHLARNIAVDTDTTDMLSSELEFRRLDREVDRLFPQLVDTLVVVVEATSPDRADTAASALAEALAKKPAHVASVFYPRDDRHFRRNAFLYATPEELDELSGRLAEAQPFLGSLWADPSLKGLARLIERAIDHRLAEGGGSQEEGVPLAGALARIADVAEDVTAGRPGTLSWRALLTGDEGEGVNRRIILLRPKLDYASLAPGKAAMREIRETAHEIGLTEDAGIRVRLTGSAALEQEELASVSEGIGIAGLVSLALVTVLLVWGFRSVRLFAATLATLLMGLLWTAAFAILALGALNLISVAFAVLFIGLGVDFAIHYGMRYREARSAGEDHLAAVAAAGGSVGGSLTLAAVCAAIGFYSFLPTDYRGLAELGLIAGTGMFIALVANLTVLPALLTLSPPRIGAAAAATVGNGSGSAAALFDALLRRRRWVLVGAAVLAAASFALATQARFDFDPLNLKDPESESVRTLFDLTEDPRISPYSATVLAPDAEAAARLADELEALPEVAEAETIGDFVPPAQAEKVDTIFGMGLFLAPSISGEPTASRGAEERAAAHETLQAALKRLAGEGEDEAAEAAVRLRAALDGMPADALADLERRLLAELPGQVARLRDALEAEAFAAGDLPQDLRRRYIADDGTARISILPARDLRDREALLAFVEAVRRVAPDATGAPFIIYEAGRAVVQAFLEAAAIAICLIAVLLAALLRRTRDVLVVFTPLVLAAGVTLAATVVAGISFNFANVIVLPLLFGLGVAGTVHLVLRAREAGARAAFCSSTPRAVVFSALTTIGSFASIGLSSHPGTASMGVLLTIAIMLTLATTMTLLPALLAGRE